MSAMRWHATKNLREKDMNEKHRIEIYSAGYATCKETIEMVRKIAGPDHEVHIHDMHQEGVASRAKQDGVRSLPAVVVDGKLAGCCAGRGPTSASFAKPCASARAGSRADTPVSHGPGGTPL